MKIYGRRSARSSSHAESRMIRNSGDSHHATASSRPVKTIPISRLHFLFSSAKNALKGKRFQDVEGIKENVTAELNAVPLRPLLTVFRKLFKRFNKCIQVKSKVKLSL
jgi:hypothetical protein